MRAKTMRRAFLLEAAVAVTAAQVALRVLPCARVFAWAARPPHRIQRFRADEIEWVAWAVEKVGGSPWVEALCLPRALAAQAMLRRRGIASRLCLGVVRKDGALAAHAWIETGREMVAVGADARGFTKIAEFGAEAA